jgi:hypothetical protein
MQETQRPARSTASRTGDRTASRAAPRFTAGERAAMKDRAQELRAAARRGPRAAEEDGESEVLAKIAEMQESDRTMADEARIVALVKRAVN